MKKTVVVISVLTITLAVLILKIESTRPILKDSYNQMIITSMDGAAQSIEDPEVIASFVKGINAHPRRFAWFRTPFADDSITHKKVVFRNGKQDIQMDYIPSKGVLYFNGRWKIQYYKYAFTPLK